MKKLLLLTLTALLANYGFAASSKNTTDSFTRLASIMQTQSSDYEAVHIDSNYKLIPQKFHEKDQQLKYTIDVIFPQISGNNLSDEAKQFNQQILTLVNNDIKQFKNGVKLDLPHVKNLPTEARNNTFRIDYDIDVIHPTQLSIISVRLSIEEMRAGRAHPYHAHRVLNFDLTNGKELALSDLFHSKAKYLAALSQYSTKKLDEKMQPSDKWMIPKGANAEAHNFKNWNLEDDAILITFDEYQVAPYAYGPQEVEIPFSELKNLLSPQAEMISSSKPLENNLG